ncbi:MAG: efflux RND transporter periplasmic adaptor subunit, partial [Pirellulales bacterium]|nr:efflux RND transporter periplasmic adaptor subunit [Pirellulales bacterium]
DTRQLKTVAEIDEYDALTIQLGQSCQITSDGTEGILARGKIVEIEPQMNPKRLFGQWAGERSDTHTRRVWIELEGEVDLPIGLPVDVFIEGGELTNRDKAN